MPIVFWGVNGGPVKYGLVDDINSPGHNVTGAWQAGYYRESLELLHRLAPKTKTFAILACSSETARAKIKAIQDLSQQGVLPLQLLQVVSTNSYALFQAEALKLADQVDAFFILNHDTLRDEQGNYVDILTVGRWYLEHLHKPETADERQFVQEGMLCVADDSGYNQAFEAVTMAVEILRKGQKPAQMKPRAPSRGPLIVNRQRAQMLGITLIPEMGIEEVIDEAAALQAPEAKGKP